MNTYLKEITDWSDSKTPVPNHTYIVRPDGHLAGYIKTGTKEEIIFKTGRKERKIYKISKKIRNRFISNC